MDGTIHPHNCPVCGKEVTCNKQPECGDTCICFVCCAKQFFLIGREPEVIIDNMRGIYIDDFLRDVIRKHKEHCATDDSLRGAVLRANFEWDNPEDPFVNHIIEINQEKNYFISPTGLINEAKEKRKKWYLLSQSTG